MEEKTVDIIVTFSDDTETITATFSGDNIPKELKDFIIKNIGTGCFETE